MLQHVLKMLLLVPILLQSDETLHLEDLKPGQSLTFSSPKSHDFTPDCQFITHFGFASQWLLKLLNFVLLYTEHRIATSPLCVYAGSLLLENCLLRTHELIYRLWSKVYYHCVQLSLKWLYVFICYHVVRCGCWSLQKFISCLHIEWYFLNRWVLFGSSRDFKIRIKPSRVRNLLLWISSSWVRYSVSISCRWHVI